jgi:adenosylmethionine-8-amino-7-oxononanoate aminotransferase
MANLETSFFAELYALDKEHIWHPYTQIKTAAQPLLVKYAKNEFLHVIDENGTEKKIIDGVSSWWLSIHGHNHSYINKRIKEQLDNFEHVIFAGFTHEPAIELVSKLIPILPKIDINADFNSYTRRRMLNKAFFSDNGSTAVEVAIKMAIQYWSNKGQSQRKQIIAFKDSYHGDTVGSMSTSDTPIFHQAFKSILFPVHFVSSPSAKVNYKLISKDLSFKHRQSIINEIQAQAEEKSLEELQEFIHRNSGQIAAVIIEPLIQGAGGMKFHSRKFLQKLRKICDQEEILLIADEVFTAFGRTGATFACEKAMIVPDIICLSKALTGGYLPMGLTVTTDRIYGEFYSDSKLKTFFHGHSFTANPLACAAAVASLEAYEQENRLRDVEFLNTRLIQELDSPEIKDLDIVRDVRIRGPLAVIEFEDEGETYLADIGPRLAKTFLDRHILVRPLGNVLYFLPPYTISVKSLDYCLQTIKDVVLSL